MFYTFSQNNSGGSFNYDEAAGISHYVIIEADSPDEANTRAEAIGLYFGGAGDCECCGNRWHETSDYDDATEVPCIYDDPITASWQPRFTKWMPGYEGFIHYKSGLITAFAGPAPQGQPHEHDCPDPEAFHMTCPEPEDEEAPDGN